MRFAPGAWRYAGISFVLGFLGVFVSVWMSLILLSIGFLTLVFYRDPIRQPLDSGFVSPADGRVSVIRVENESLRVGVFMGVTNVHVNRAPVTGTIESVEHTPGSHRPAFTKESDRNERVRTVITRTQSGENITVILIAGAFARRITPYIEPGDTIKRGQRIGHIAFGSRADIILPNNIDRTHLQVGMGDRVRAGETIIARDPTHEDPVNEEQLPADR